MPALMIRRLRRGAAGAFLASICAWALFADANAAQFTRQPQAVAPTARALGPMPIPVVRVTSLEQYWVGRQAWLRFELRIENSNDFDQALFQSEPALGPCPYGPPGTGRAAVAVQHALLFHYLAAFCSDQRNDLRAIKATMRKGGAPKHVMVRITDRVTNQTVQSNIVMLATRPSPTSVPYVRPPVSPN